MRGPLRCFVAVLLCSVAGPSGAVDVTFAFTGVVTAADDPDGVFDGSIQFGTPVTGHYTFSTDTVPVIEPLFPFGTQATYTHLALPYVMRIDAGNYRFETDPASPHLEIVVKNDFMVTPTVIADSFGVSTEDPLVTRGLAAGQQISVTAASLGLLGEYFSDVSLPTEPPQPDLVSSGYLSGSGTPCYGEPPGCQIGSSASFSFEWEVLTHTIPAVPALSTVARVLLGAALGCLGLHWIHHRFQRTALRLPPSYRLDPNRVHHA